MESIRIIPNLEQKGFRDGEYGVTPHEGDVVVGAMPRGTESGKPTVIIGLEQPGGGGFLVVETTLALFLTAADALKAAHGDPRT